MGQLVVTLADVVVGIIESDDIALLSQEVDKAINFSKKCAMLVDSVKKKYNLVGCHVIT